MAIPSPVPARLLFALALVLWARPALAEVRLTLQGPTRTLASGEECVLRPTLTGAGSEPGCHWAVAEGGRVLTPKDGVRVEEREGAFYLTATNATQRQRHLRFRLAAKKDPNQFRVVDIEVAPQAAGSAGAREESKLPAGAREESKLPAGAVAGTPKAPLEVSHPFVWATPFDQKKSRGALNQMIWDDRADEPALLTARLQLDRDGHWDQWAVMRRKVDGAEEAVSKPGAGASALDFCIGGMAQLPNGDLVYAEAHRILRIAADGTVTPLAGTGQGGTVGNGDTDDQGQPRPATDAIIGYAKGVAVTPQGEVVYADSNLGLIRKFTPGGPIVTVAGGGAGTPAVNDFNLRYPGRAARLGTLGSLAVGPDGRIAFTGMDGRIYVIHPDGTLAPAVRRSERNIRPFLFGDHVSPIAVTARNEIAFFDEKQSLCLIRPDGTTIRLTRTNPGSEHEGTPKRYLAPAEEVRLEFPAALTALPGGGLLFMEAGRKRVWFIGSSKNDHLLAHQVMEAFHAAMAGEFPKVARILQALLRWAEPGAMNLDRIRWAWSRPLSQGGFKEGLPAPVERMVFGHLKPEQRVLSFRARLALRAFAAQLADHPMVQDGLSDYIKAQSESAGLGLEERKQEAKGSEKGEGAH